MTVVKASKTINKYFDTIDSQVKQAYEVATAARKKGLDPEDEAPIPIARNMAERVVGLISVVAPQILGTPITDRIIELEKEYGLLDWRVGFKIAEEVAKEIFCKFDNKLQAMEVGIRVGFAYLTLGIVSAPLEGFIGLKLKKRADGKEYFSLQYAGPIRAAGGTAASTSVILADYVRVKLGYAPWDPTEKEVSRYCTDVHDYHDRVTNLQYHPSDEELKFLIANLPVEVDGDPTEKREVSNFKDIPRIETNMIRGGVALVLAEGLSQKAPKLWKRLSKWGKDFDLEWEWMQQFLKIKEEVHASHGKKKEKKKDGKKTLKPNNTFIMDIVAGRPIFTHPMATGGFRLRYGRVRTSGFSTAAMHPATLAVLDDFIGVGTQLKVERPGKAATIVICDTICGPVVRLHDGSVHYLDTIEKANQYRKEVDEVLFLGDFLFNYGDFSENGHSLVPCGYCPEWWALEVEKALETKQTTLNKERLEKLLKDPLFTKPTLSEAVQLSQELEVPLHSKYLFYWSLLTLEGLEELTTWLIQGKLKTQEGEITKLILPLFNEQHKSAKKRLEEVGIPHLVINKEQVVIQKQDAQSLALHLNITSQEDLTKLSLPQKETPLEIINTLSQVLLKDLAGTFIGARMGRPEKAKMRKLSGSPQVMFPVGEEGDRLRSFQAALQAKKVTSSFAHYWCEACQKESIYRTCEVCNKRTEKKHYCKTCGTLDKEECRHGPARTYKSGEIDIVHYFNQAKKHIQEKLHPDLIKGVKGTSNKDHVVEHLAKGILRAKHGVYVNKDGTTRYDCTELPCTHFKPKEIHTSVAKLKELGYTHDIKGEELVNDNQILEMRPQDVILPGFDSLEESAPKVLLRVAKFVDELLVKFYKLEPYYNAKTFEDLAGHLVIGLAPHISAGLVGRIIGYSNTQGLITHPMYHAGMRRDCDGDEAAVLLLMDALLNFSRQYLPERRGAKTMDAALVLTTKLNPTEVDDQVHGVDVMWKYPLEFYEAAQEMKNPWEVKWGEEGKKITQLGDRLGTELQFEDFGFTHQVDDMNKTVLCSAYKTLPSMVDKLDGQMELARKIRAVDMDDVARLTIERHFLRDIKGNFRKFSMQKFRCVKCNAKYTRPPIVARCTVCHGKLLFTISEGSVVKYLKPSLVLAKKYNFSPYLTQTIDMLKLNIDKLFGKEKDTQVGLGAFMK